MTISHWNQNMVALRLGSVSLPLTKKCNCCGAVHCATPEDAVICKLGHLWFNCHCGSTLVINNYRDHYVPLCA